MNLLNALKNQKNLDVDLSGFVGNKDNFRYYFEKFIPNILLYQQQQKYIQKIMKKINRLFYYNRHH